MKSVINGSITIVTDEGKSTTITINRKCIMDSLDCRLFASKLKKQIIGAGK